MKQAKRGGCATAASANGLRRFLEQAASNRSRYRKQASNPYQVVLARTTWADYAAGRRHMCKVHVCQPALTQRGEHSVHTVASRQRSQGCALDADCM